MIFNDILLSLYERIIAAIIYTVHRIFILAEPITAEDFELRLLRRKIADRVRIEYIEWFLFFAFLIFETQFIYRAAFLSLIIYVVEL